MGNKRLMAHICRILALCSNVYFAFVPSVTFAVIQFEDISSFAGLSYRGNSYGASWGDLNGDGWPDLWLSNHGNPSSLYINLGNGAFEEVADERIGTRSGDTHGAAWADFDNDGDQDVLQLVGAGSGTGSGENQLYVNDSGVFSEKAEQYGLTYPLGRGRTPTWLDWNKDGRLDVFLGNWRRSDAPSAVFTQQQSIFKNDNDGLGVMVSGNIRFAQLANLIDPNTSLLIPSLIIAGGPFPDSIYRLDTIPFEDIRELLGFPSVFSVWDTAIADLNGDLTLDFYLARADVAMAAKQTDLNTIKATLRVNSEEKGFSFKTSGEVYFNIQREKIRTSAIYVGEQGWHPGDQMFTLSPASNTIEGLFPHTPGSDVGVFIEFVPSSNQWNVFVSSNAALTLNIEVQADEPVAELTSIGFENSDGEKSDQMLFRQGQAFVDVSAEAGLGEQTACESVVAADFDNDMDVDLYLVCRGTVTNLPNLLYENQGGGTFNAVSGAGRAEGSSIGRGDSAVTADFDRDGFVDIFITNGNGEPPFSLGPDQLFRNVGNSNRWIEVDLEGVVTNRDGIGARLLATAGGITQLREQTGGMHRFSQNHSRIHFGLGSNALVDKLVIKWPSGIVQQLHNIPANKIIKVIEEDTDPDNDGVHNDLDLDDDNDGLTDTFELGIGANPLLADSDGDTVPDIADNCILDDNPDQLDTDADGYGDMCDPDFVSEADEPSLVGEPEIQSGGRGGGSCSIIDPNTRFNFTMPLLLAIVLGFGWLRQQFSHNW